MSTMILAPWAKDEVSRLGQRTWEKEILRFGKVSTDDGEFDFTPEFGTQMVDAFQAGVMDSVPLELANDTNDHTQAVDRSGGEVVGLRLTDTGLNGIIRTDPRTTELVESNRRLGVSIRALQGRLDNAGRRWPAVLHHVLATFDPVVTGMSPWQPVELANDVTRVINLANPAGPDTEVQMADDTVGNLSAEEAEKLHALLGKMLGKDGKDETVEDDGEQDTEADEVAASVADDSESDDDLDLTKLTDEELEALLLAEDHTPDETGSADGTVDEGAEERELEPVAASRTSSGSEDVIELANARFKEQAVELARMRDELDTANYDKERDSLVKTTGLPPRVIDLARPLLQGAGRVVELSNGTKVDAGKVVREVFTEIGKTFKALDLARPSGFAVADDENDGEAENRAEFLSRVKKEFRLGG